VTAALRTAPVPRCPLCGIDADVRYEGLRDRLFGAPGLWRYRQCPRCALLWQDPMVEEADVGSLYETYYTHAAPSPTGDSLPRRLNAAARRGVQASRLGYQAGAGARLLGALLALHPGRRDDAAFRAMFLPASARGRVLDVGCGHGATLAWLRDLGWDAEGIEPDPHAAEVARASGFRVGLGTVFTADVPAGAFDAVVLSHVVEHVHRPVDMLARCRSFLVPGGRLVAVTPNVESRGHATFGHNWRGLEPPRHLHVFSRAALAEAARQAGFAEVDVQVTIRAARGFYDASVAIGEAERNAGTAAIGPPTLRAEVWQLGEWWETRRRAEAGEELVLMARHQPA
jgi:2-polyprenyl-3-methyl-5-hydroxy-6-metoxy-1,4-benzoquinol methylase